MKAVLEVNINELNANFLEIMRSMFQKNVSEIVLKPQLTLEEFDKSLPLEEITGALKERGHNATFIEEVKDGLKNSSIYNENES